MHEWCSDRVCLQTLFSGDHLQTLPVAWPTLTEPFHLFW